MEIRRVAFDHPDAIKLNAEVQHQYAELYDDEGDLTPLDAAMFEPPAGVFLVAYDDGGTPVASGGWLARDSDEPGHLDGDAEVKRMYVVESARRQGLARRVLAALEDDARAVGRARMVLMTGALQPEAIALYTSSGYTPCVTFGLYRSDPLCRCFAKPLRP
jgi:GNAT superfamily N-acetyltransferase